MYVAWYLNSTATALSYSIVETYKKILIDNRKTGPYEKLTNVRCT